jgi:hypothetical protein
MTDMQVSIDPVYIDPVSKPACGWEYGNIPQSE